MISSFIPPFNRDLFGSKETFTRIGEGYIGGKATGLYEIKEHILTQLDTSAYKNISVTIPILTVLTTEVFDNFMEQNKLYELDFDSLPDDRIAHAFHNSEFPFEYVGDIRGLIEKVTQPLAIRSSSLLEDAIDHPFAGVYGTKMIPNNQHDVDKRHRKLLEAIKFVYASTFFKEARDYIKVTGKKVTDEKMAVIIQEVVGKKYGMNFYPSLSGVGRTFNFYPYGHATPQDGVLVLALGLGKTIVDGGKTWSVSPKYPKQPPPYNSNQDIIKQTQSEFWAVDMGETKKSDPLKESEYLILHNIEQAEFDDTIKYLASTYVAANDRIVIGCGNPGPRVLDFAPLLRLGDIPIIDVVENFMQLSKKQVKADVEIEFAAVIDDDKSSRIGMLQVRPMKLADESVQIDPSELKAPNLLLSSDRVLGNGQLNDLHDIIYVKPETFNAKDTPKIAEEIALLNAAMVDENRHYLLIGFGRWGSSDSWLGIPVVWSQIANAKIIVEATLPDMDVDLSQGAHFFHNLTSFKIFSFSIHHAGAHRINFDWLTAQPAFMETTFVKQIRTEKPLLVKSNSQSNLGIIHHG